MQRIRHHFQIILLIATALILGNCSNGVIDNEDNETTEETNSETVPVRFIHASANASLVDFMYLDESSGTRYEIAGKVAYGNQVGYYSFPAGELTIDVYISGTNIIVSTMDVQFENDRIHTIVFTDYEAGINPQLTVFQDSTMTPDEGISWLSIMHATPKANAVDIELDYAPYTTGLNHLERTPYLSLVPGTHPVTLYRSSDGQPLLNAQNVTLISDVSYTLILTGTTDENLEGLIFQDISLE